jgi:Na+/phosphate symporter
MGAISDEIANIVQYVKDVWDRIDHKLTDQGKTEMSKLHDQATAVLDMVKSDIDSDAADVKTDVGQDVAAANQAAAPSAPPVAPAVPATTEESPITTVTPSQS